MKHESISLHDGSTIELPIPENYRDSITLIQSDKYRILGEKCSYWYVCKELIFHPFANPLMWFRLCQYRGRAYRLCFFMYQRSCRKYCLDIPHTTRVGYGFYIGHGICIVINGGTIIGNNVNVSQFTNIGSNEERHAIIGDNVWMGPSVCIVEDVQIGSGSSIGAGAVVVKNIPHSATAVGVPAKIVNFNNPERYIKNKWK